MIETPCAEATAVVDTANVADVVPTATDTLTGTPATAAFALERDTEAPPSGAGPVRVTVPTETPPPIIEDGDVATDATPEGVTVTSAVRVSPPAVPVSVTGVDAATGEVVMLKVAEEVPAATVTVAGTDATEVFALDSVMSRPPARATPVRVSVPVADVPPATVVGLTLTVERTGV